MLRNKSTALLGGVVFLALFGLTSCVGEGRVHVTGHAHVDAPRLVYIGPGIWVVEDYGEPVFYSNGYYWRYDNGIWYRSSIHHGSWVVVRNHAVPGPVLRIDRPRAYVHYHARAGAKVRRGPVKARDHRKKSPKVRDHRKSERKQERVPARRGRKH